MKTEQLIAYTQKKELSSKAKKEIIELIKQEPAVNISEVKELFDILLKLHTDVIYKFITECLIEYSVDYLEESVNCIKAFPSNKSRYILVSGAAFASMKKINMAETLLETYVTSCVSGAKINKQCFIDFEKICSYPGSEIFFEKFDRGIKSVNAYRRFFGELLCYSQNEDCKKNIKKWFDINNKPLSKKEQEVLLSGNSEINEQQPQCDAAKKEKPKKSSDFNDIDLSQLLKLFNVKIEGVISQLKSKEQEVLSLNEELKMCKLENTKIKAEIESLKKIIIGKDGERDLQNSTINQLNQELNIQVKKINDLNNQIYILKSKLSNVESAFGQAGENEVGELKNKIRSRLLSDYEKYSEIKEKAPDIDYYEIILVMLDEIFKVLKKNGIEF